MIRIDQPRRDIHSLPDTQAEAVNAFPPMRVEHGSQALGQVYIPTVNYILMVFCIGLVIVLQVGRSSLAMSISKASL